MKAKQTNKDKTDINMDKGSFKQFFFLFLSFYYRSYIQLGTET